MVEPLTFFIITRKLFDSPIWQDDPHILKLFIYLIGTARHSKKPKKFHGFQVKRGELVTSLRDISQANGYRVGKRIKTWSPSRVKRMLEYLQEWGYIAMIKDTYGTHINICNYDHYQSKTAYKRTTAEQQRTPAELYNNVNNVYNDNKKKTTSPKSCPPKHTENHVPYQLSKLLFDLMLENNPKAKKPNLQRWADPVEKMIRLDNRTPQEIEHVIRWAQQDDFWKGNILSTTKLRKQFDQLWIKSNKPTRANQRFQKNLQSMKGFLNAGSRP